MDGQNLNEFVNIRWTEQPSYESAIKTPTALIDCGFTARMTRRSPCPPVM